MTGAQKRLAELHRVTQVGLEQYRTDPDDEQTWADYLRVKADRDAAWLEHVAGLERA